MKPTTTPDPHYFLKVIDCQYACPAHTPVPQYIRHIANKEYDKAYQLNWESNVFPGVLGRICDRPCEPACRRGRIEKEPVAICRLKRLAADQKTAPRVKLPEMATSNGKKIALIGGGPASLTVARDLLPLGYEVHLYDDQKKAGGFIRTQVPSFRLPEPVLEEEVNRILEMGVHHHSECRIESLQKVLSQDYDAIFVGTGAPRGRDLQLIGRNEFSSQIHVGIEWLAAILYRHVESIGKRVLVLGGGNTAMDCCRSARRLGGHEVSIVVRSPKAKMKASPWEIEDALREGVSIIDNLQPVEFIGSNGKLSGIRFTPTTTVYDKTGKAQTLASGESDIFIACDEVILAVGQENAFPWIEEELQLLDPQTGRPQLNPETLQANGEPRLFFGGDAAFGPKNVITAVAHGHQAAISMDLYCRGKNLQNRPPLQMNLLSQKMGLYEWAYDNQISTEQRNQVPLEDPVKSINDRLLEVEKGFNRELGAEEAERCLNCDIQTIFEATTCIECDACVDICPVSCITFTGGDKSEEKLRQQLRIPATNLSQSLYISPPTAVGNIMVKDENVCLHCGLCADRCPTASWQMFHSLILTAQAGHDE